MTADILFKLLLSPYLKNRLAYFLDYLPQIPIAIKPPNVPELYSKKNSSFIPTATYNPIPNPKTIP